VSVSGRIHLPRPRPKEPEVLKNRRVQELKTSAAGLLSIVKYETSSLYVTPKIEDWPCYDGDKYVLGGPGESMANLTVEEARSLELVRVWCDMKKERGRTRNAGTYNWKKLGISRAAWKAPNMRARDLTPKARAAYEWLLQHNATYADWHKKHEDIMQKGPHPQNGYVFQTWNLLLHSPGIEVAAFPLLYPQQSFGDTNARERLLQLGWLQESNKTSIGFSYMKKLTSPCLSYAQEPRLMFLLHDVHFAKQIMTKLTMAESKNITADVMASGTRVLPQA